MARIVVFDSGLGSLSIIKAIQKRCKAEIIYFADRENFPYGKKSKKELEKIIKKSIQKLKGEFYPDLIVIGSNTPTIMLDLTSNQILGVNPPLKEAGKKSITKNIAILATETVVKSRMLSDYIKNCKISTKIAIHKVNSSSLVQLVESGKFIENKDYCRKLIKKKLFNEFVNNNIDTATLSSTHLPFLKPLLESEFPKIEFLDPADNVAKNIFSKIKTKQSKKNSLKIFTSDKTNKFQKNLKKMGIKNKIEYFSI